MGWRAENPTSTLSIRADFDGDGRVEGANIGIRAQDDKVFLYTSVRTRLHKLQELTREELRRSGIKPLATGSYTVQCIREPDVSCDGEESWELQNVGIVLLLRGQPRTLFFWDSDAEAFQSKAITEPEK